MLIYVGNLSPNVSENNLRQIFDAFGKVSFAIISSTIFKDKYSGQSRGFAFVEMSDQTEGRAAIKNLHRKDLFGREMVVYEAHLTNGRERPEEKGFVEDDRIMGV